MFISLIFWAVAAPIFDFTVKRVEKTRQKSVFCVQRNYWLISSRFQSNSPSLRHARTIWDAESEIRMFWNGSQTENVSLQNYRYHEKLAKFAIAKCFRHVARPNTYHTIGVLTSKILTYRKFSRLRWKKVPRKKRSYRERRQLPSKQNQNTQGKRKCFSWGFSTEMIFLEQTIFYVKI